MFLTGNHMISQGTMVVGGKNTRIFVRIFYTLECLTAGEFCVYFVTNCLLSIFNSVARDMHLVLEKSAIWDVTALSAPKRPK